MSERAVERALPQASGRARALAIVVAQACGMAVALTAAAKLRIYLPGSVVPITLQTFVALAGGALLGVGGGAGGAALYAGLASAGLPLMAGAGVVGPTGGYVLGFVAAAAMAAWARDRRPLTLLAALIGAHLVIYACGAAWLAAWTGSVRSALVTGVAPFVFGDALKVAAVWTLAMGSRARHRGGE
jgi:biotin transport system substrate-specific component